MRSPRVVFAHYDAPLEFGGVSTWIHGLIPAMRAKGVDARVHILNVGEGIGSNTRYFQNAGIPIKFAKLPITHKLGVQQCVRWINEDRPDIYVPNSVLCAYYAGAYAKRTGLKTVGVLHSPDTFFTAAINDYVGGPPELRFSAVVPVSAQLKTRVDAFGFADMPCVQIPCGVAVPNVTAAVPNGRFRLVYLGRLVEEAKQVSEVARAMCAAAARHPNIEAVIAGDGPSRGSVEQILASQSLDGRVRLVGRLNHEEVYQLLRSCHLFVLLSDYEGLPVSMLEAMATGVVPICLQTESGIGEVLRHGKNGYIVKNRGEDFQSAVTRLIEEPGLWTQLSANARAAVENGYSNERCQAYWFSLLSALGTVEAPQFPVPIPRKVPHPNPLFGWHEPDALCRLLPALTPFRNAFGRWRRQLISSRRSSPAA